MGRLVERRRCGRGGLRERRVLLGLILETIVGRARRACLLFDGLVCLAGVLHCDI